MYPSDGFVYTSFTDNDFNPSLEIQDLSSPLSCLFHSSSPFNLYEDEAIYSQHLHAIFNETNHQGVVGENNVLVNGNTENSSKNDVNMEEYMCAGGNTTDLPFAKKKMSKKDRHSKINTAHGPRDRRMRLSLDVAQKFFGLQDMLGFDKPSKTMEWLLTNSKLAIEEVSGSRFPNMNKGSPSNVTVSASSKLDCDVVSGTTSWKNVPPSTRSKEKWTRSVRKPAFNPRAKESREKARERARERTKEKRRQQQQQQQQLDVQQSTSLMTWRPFGTGEEPVSTNHNTSNYNDKLSIEVEKMQIARKHQLQSQGIREECINICNQQLIGSLQLSANFWNFS